jgi:hypothetical protein
MEINLLLGGHFYGMTSLLEFMKIYKLAQMLLAEGEHRQTDRLVIS